MSSFVSLAHSLPRPDLVPRENDAMIRAMLFIDWNAVPVLSLAPGVRTRTPHGERIMLSLIEIDEGAAVPPHSHPHEQAGYVLEGTLELTVGGDVRTLGAGDAYIVPGDAPHSARSIGGRCRVLDVFSPVREDYAAAVNADAP